MSWSAIFTLFLLVASGSNIRTLEKTPMIVAHRGASASAPENTLASFRMGFAEGADRIEGDFRITADGRVVCIHDETTARTAGESGSLVVKDTEYSRLNALDVGSWKGPRFKDERIVSLEEVLAIVPPTGGVVIELKGPSSVARPAAEIVKASGIGPDRISFIAFDAETLAEVKRAAPDYPTWYLSGFKQDKQTGKWTPEVEELLATAKRINADGLDLKAMPEVIDETFVAAIRRAGLAWHVWTVNDPSVARRMVELGVDSITTDIPGKMRAALADSQ